MNTEVDAYIRRSDRWPAEIAALRPVLLSCGLVEDLKWGKPCYSHAGGNIVILQEMKDFLALMFFKGTLLEDPDGVLEDQGPNSRSARRMTFSSTDEVSRRADVVERYVKEAMRVEETGLEIGPPPALELVDELRNRLEEHSDLATAFAALTPGRQREYNLYVSGAKQSSTRETRVDRCTERILEGRGLRDR